MAFIATQSALEAPHSVFGRAFSAVGRFFTAYVESRSRHAEYAALERLSDAELAARGLTRDGIARAVFADILYL